VISKYTYEELNPIHKLVAIPQANGCGHPNCLLENIFVPAHTTGALENNSKLDFSKQKFNSFFLSDDVT